MNNLRNQLLEAIYNFDLQYYRRPTKIKVTSDIYNRLAALCTYELIYSRQDECRLIFGIPVEIDDTIKNYYELIYEEN